MSFLYSNRKCIICGDKLLFNNFKSNFCEQCKENIKSEVMKGESNNKK